MGRGAPGLQTSMMKTTCLLSVHTTHIVANANIPFLGLPLVLLVNIVHASYTLRIAYEGSAPSSRNVTSGVEASQPMQTYAACIKQARNL